ncbi:MAG: hypothetical protein HY907_22280, partial [Deltaproteobacteria bacterium]|nr:hypothetical protein [Deltaproteobacteria bacterium]
DGALQARGGEGGAAGASGAAGGAGGGGRVRIDAPGTLPLDVDAATVWHGPAVDVAALDLVTPGAEAPMNGRGEPGATIRVANFLARPTQFTETTVSPDGTFALVVPLLPGLNDLEVSQSAGGLSARSFTGTMYELVGRAVVGARIYIVRVPEVE